MGFNWSKDLERATLKLWNVVSSRFQKQMKTAKEKREWLRKKLVEMKRDGKLLASPGENDVEDLTDDLVKNKIAGLKKLGKKMMERWIVPILKRNKKEPPTGSGVDDDDQQLDGDAIEEVDWGEIENKCKWHLVRLYFELFGDQPTWGCGLGGAVDTATVVCEESQGATKLVVAAPVGETNSTSSTSSEDDGAARRLGGAQICGEQSRNQTYGPVSWTGPGAIQERVSRQSIKLANAFHGCSNTRCLRPR